MMGSHPMTSVLIGRERRDTSDTQGELHVTAKADSCVHMPRNAQDCRPKLGRGKGGTSLRAAGIAGPARH